jgi:transposase-like protein
MGNCPTCKEKNSMTPYMGLQFGKYICKKCEYIGAIVLEEEDKK